MLIGTAINSKGLKSDPKYRELIASNFNCVYPENGFKLLTINKQEGYDYDFSEADLAVKFAFEHNLEVRGHCLVWHFSIPEWLSTKNSVERNRKKIENYFEAVLLRYPQIVDWDICNECLNDQGYPRKHLGFLLGQDYIAWAYKLAHAIRPDARLFYCDNQIRLGQKWNAISKMLVSMRESGVPVHGVAMQVHASLGGTILYRFAWEICRFQEMKFEVQVPEVVIWNDRSVLGGQSVQMMTYQSIIQTCYDRKVSLAGFWSPFDVYPWLMNPQTQCHPGFWDINHHPKPIVRWLREKLRQATSDTSQT